MKSLFELLDGVFGHYEPASYDSSQDTPSLSLSAGPEILCDWHNDFGTSADFQGAAEAFNSFQSNDWSSWRD